jgi:hypothetical protein
MTKGSVLPFLATAILIVMINISVVGSSDQFLNCLPSCGGVVDKAPGGAFTVEICFKNIGKTEATWSVNIAFEGEKWIWAGNPQTLTLAPSNTKTLAWNGSVPTDAPIDSMTRLIVYYGDSFTVLDWWIHVVPSAQLTITTSTVK